MIFHWAMLRPLGDILGLKAFDKDRWDPWGFIRLLFAESLCLKKDLFA